MQAMQEKELKENTTEIKVLSNELRNQRVLLKIQMENIDKRLNTMQWIMSGGFALIGIAIALLKLVY